MSAITVEWFRPGTVPAADQHALSDMFAEVAGDFVPPLTSREGTTQAGLRDLSASAPGGYFEEMLEQDLILCRVDGRAVGFLSFRAEHEDPRYAELCPCLYVSTIAVRHEQRRGGVARALYRHLFALPAFLPSWVVLRTWSTNSGHLLLLKDLGFATILQLPDDRATGVDTVYLAADRSVPAEAVAQPTTPGRRG